MNTRKQCKMLADEIASITSKKVNVGSISSDYTENKYVIIADEEKSFYQADSRERKTFKTWKEAENYLRGIFKGINISLNR